MIQIKIYGTADVLSSLNALNEVTISELSSADSSPFTLRCLSLDPQYNLEGEAVATAGGARLSARGLRSGITARAYPIYFGTASDKYANSNVLPALMDKLNGFNYHYIEFYNYGQSTVFVSNASTKALAVAWTGLEYDHNHEFGTKIITLKFDGYKGK